VHGVGGLLYGLNECGIHPKHIVAVSGSVGSAVYFCAGQYEAGKRIWTEHLASDRFISFSRPLQIIDIDYLIDDVLRTYETIQWEAVRSSKTHIICPVHAVYGESVKIGSNYDIDYEFLRASMALPVIYGKNVMLNGVAYRDFAFTPFRIV
jgi:predicted patatin/cPLA2 family phospholipase